MLTCLSRSVSVRSHGRLASLKHPVLSPPPLWNTPNKTPPKSTTNSYSLKLISSFFPFPSIPQPPFSAKSVQISSVPLSLSISIVRFRPRRCPPIFLFPPISISRSLTLTLSFTTRSRSLYSLNCLPYTMLLITELIFFHHIHQLFHNYIRDPNISKFSFFFV